MKEQRILVNRHFIASLLERSQEEWDELNADYALRGRIDAACRELARRAYAGKDDAALLDMHEALSLIHEQDFGSARIDRTDRETQPVLRDIAATLERAMLDAELEEVPADMLSSCPADPADFVLWLKRIVSAHDAARHPFYHTFLRRHADADDMRYYLAQETSLDPRFDDILALMQVGTSGAEKMEIACNYWDEMGNGKMEDVHTALFADALRALDVNEEYVRESLLLEAKVSANLSSCLALSRRHHFKAVGYFGVTEYLVPRRFKCFTEGWRRLGLPASAIKYHDLHIQIDSLHGAAWLKNVVMPLVERDPRIGREIALGAWIRLNSSRRYLDALMRRLTPCYAMAA